jgi:hypothetical protein
MKVFFGYSEARLYQNQNDERVMHISGDNFGYRADGLCAMPYRNLVTNIGAGAESTHTARQQSFFTGRRLESLGLPVQHPKSVQTLEAANRHTDRLIMMENTRYGRVLQRLLFWVRPLIGARHVAT